MKPDLENIKLIESYLDGEMTNKEREEFEKLLTKDKELIKALELHRDIREAFKFKGKEELREELNNFYNNYKEGIYRKRTGKILWPVISVAASIIIFLFIYLGRNTDTIPSDKVITLDTAGLKKAPVYADSAKFDTTIYKDSINN